MKSLSDWKKKAGPNYLLPMRNALSININLSENKTTGWIYNILTLVERKLDYFISDRKVSKQRLFTGI